MSERKLPELLERMRDFSFTLAPIDLEIFGPLFDDLCHALRVGDRKGAIAAIEAAVLLKESSTLKAAQKTAQLWIAAHEEECGPIGGAA